MLSLCRPQKPTRGSGGTAPLILNFDTRWRWEVKFTLRPLLLWGTHYSGGWVSCSGRFLEQKKSFFSIRIRTPDCPARSRHYTNWAMLSPTEKGWPRNRYRQKEVRVHKSSRQNTAQTHSARQRTNSSDIRQQFTNKSRTTQERIKFEESLSLFSLWYTDCCLKTWLHYLSFRMSFLVSCV
jgi:hypothetical protein